jgi:imidazoleglycerol-phosphate dehydratase
MAGHGDPQVDGGARRTAAVERKTSETSISLRLALDGRGEREVSTGIRFFDHMLESFARHAGMDLELQAAGDLDVDQHHTVEDVGIALGETVDRALGDKLGIARAGCFLMPMDETLAVVAVDFCGRSTAVVDARVRAAKVGDLQASLVPDFFEGFAHGARCTVHARVLYGRSAHHKVEALFKAFARAVAAASRCDPRLEGVLPSTKGLL